MIAPTFTLPTATEDGALHLDRVEDFDPAMLPASPAGIVGIYTQAGRHFSVVVGNYVIGDGEAEA